jgi:hypothetical protein
MSRKPLVWRLIAMLPLLILFMLVHCCLPLVAVAVEPIITQSSTGLQATIAGLGPSPAAGNATPLLVVAQLNLDQAPQPPFHIAPVPLNLAGSSLVLGPSSIPPTINCGASSATLLVCTLTPAGATWGTSGFVVFTILLTAMDGHSVMSAPVILNVQ